MGCEIMKKIIYRILAYVFDILLVTLLTVGITQLPIFSDTNSEVGALYVNLSTIEMSYNTLNEKLDNFYEDGKISENELEDINTSFSLYKDCFKNIKVEEEVTNEIKNNITKEINEKRVELKNECAYNINKINTTQSIIGIVLYILYFGIFQYFMKGQTIGKKIFRLKVVGTEKEKVSLLNYIFRSILVCEILITGIDLLLLFILNKSQYISSNYWIMQAKYLYEILFVIVMIIRDDNRSVHDLLLNTKVIRMDKEGKEVVEQLFKDKNEKVANKAN